MPLGYKYVERDATSYVDWNAIGKNMTDMLKEEMSIREQKKKAIDDASVELGNVFENAPQGTNKPMNEWALEFASDGQKARLLQDRLLKSGYLKLKDYTIQRQNLNDGTDQAFKLSKQYQDEYKSTMDAYNSSNPDEQIQDLNIFLMKSIEGFSNFSQTRLVINPKDGSVGARKLVMDPTTGKPKMGANGLPEFSDNPNDFATINSLNKWMQQKYAKFNVEKNVKEFVGSLGSEINTISKLGGIHHFGTTTETLNIANRKYFPKNDQDIIMKFEEAEKLALQSRLDTPYKTSSVLTNSLIYAPNGKQYDFTWDETEAKNDGHFILLKVDPNGQGAPVPQPTEKQQADALRYLTVQARLQYDKQVKIKQEDQLARNDVPQPVRDANNADKNADNTARAIGTLWGGKNGADVQRATSAFRDMNSDVKKVTRTPTGVTVELVVKGKREKRSLPFYGSDGKLMTQEQFIQSASALLGGGTDINSAIKRGGLIKGATFNETADEFSEATDITPTSSGAAAGKKGELN
jgi:hypothetical protein